MPIKRGRQKEFKQVLGKCLVFGSRMNSCVKNTLVYQSTLPLHRLKLPIPRLKRQATECQAEGWTRAWRGMTFGHEFNQKLEGVKLPNNLPNSTFGRVYPIPCGYINTTYPRTPHTHTTYHKIILSSHIHPPFQDFRSWNSLALPWMGMGTGLNINIILYLYLSYLWRRQRHNSWPSCRHSIFVWQGATN